MVFTYAPLFLDYGGKEMWNIDWHIWAIIGVTILWVSMASIILRLYFEIRRFHSKKYQIDMELKERQLKEIIARQHTMDTRKLI